MNKILNMSFVLGVLVGFLCVSAHADNPLSIVGVADPLFAKVVLMVYAVNTVLSAVRQILFKFDGIDPGGQIPSGAPSILNTVCVYLGKALDFLQGNTQH